MKSGLRKTVSALGLVASLTVAPKVMAQVNPNDISLGLPSTGGTGCPAGSVDATLSADGQSLSILFDEYMVEAGGASGRSVARKACNVAIPVHVPQGFAVSLIQIDYRGFNSLPQGAQSRLSAEYFFAGSQGPVQEKTFYGGLDDEYLLTSNLNVNSLTWSECGRDVILRAKTSLMVRNYNRRMEALSSVDSVDARAGIIYQLQWRRCDGSTQDSFGFVPDQDHSGGDGYHQGGSSYNGGSQYQGGSSYNGGSQYQGGSSYNGGTQYQSGQRRTVYRRLPRARRAVPRRTVYRRNNVVRRSFTVRR